jgi:hypothetical protein
VEDALMASPQDELRVAKPGGSLWARYRQRDR